MNNKEKLAITLGDPSGIGPEVIIKAISSLYGDKENLPIIIGDTKTVEKTAKKLDIKLSFKQINSIDSYDQSSKEIQVLDNNKYSEIDFPVGDNSVESGNASHEWVETATDLAITKKVDAICTAPNK
jgi:Pyridoxal phosphate biosynthesis protein